MIEKKLCIPPQTTIQDAISVLVDGGRKIVFITDEKNKLLGIMTNGDMRRFLLTGKSLLFPVSMAMNPSPRVFSSLDSAKKCRELENYIVYPIVDVNGYLLDAIYPINHSYNRRQISKVLQDVPLVIMAGGKGTRLYPYTKIFPKAIIPIGQHSISERIIYSFYQYGCKQVYMIINHKAGLVKAYFSEINVPCKIDFIKEDVFLGTAGGLALLRNTINSTFMLSNCDILIRDDIACAYLTHKKEKNYITFICSMQSLTVPYGVIENTLDGQIKKIIEKPQYSFLANTGVYILEPEVLQEIKDNEFIHITDLAERCIKKGMRVGVFPISGKAWLDMGQIDNMEHMIELLGEESI